MNINKLLQHIFYLLFLITMVGLLLTVITAQPSCALQC